MPASVKKIVDVGVRGKKNKTEWRVKMCIFDPVRACVLWFGFERLYERLTLRALDEMRKHHFLFAG